MVKTITIMDDAYEVLKRLKRRNESFSEVIRRVGKEKKINLSEWVGILKDDVKRVKEFHSETKRIREEVSQDSVQRNVRS